MSKPDTMAKLPGLHEHGGVYQLRVVIPLDLRPAFGGRTKPIQSLKTADRREASIEGARRRAELLQGFKDRRRALNPQPVATLGPDLGRILGERLRASILQGSQERASGNSPWPRWSPGGAHRPLTKACMLCGVALHPSDPPAVRINFDFLDPGDGFTLRILHTSDSSAVRLAGVLKGVSMRDNDARARRRPGLWYPLLMVLALVTSIYSISYGFQARPDELWERSPWAAVMFAFPFVAMFTATCGRRLKSAQCQ